MWDKGLFPSFEEGTQRPLNKCLATLNRAQRGRSERCCNSCLTSPAAPRLSNVAFGLIGAASPPSKEGNKVSSWSFQFIRHPALRATLSQREKASHNPFSAPTQVWS